MAHNSYIRPSGVWIGFTDLFSEEMGRIDTALFKAINGDDGGTWAPGSVITIGGAGVTILITGSDSQLQHGGTFTNHGDMVFASDGTTHFLGVTTCSGSTTFDGFATTNFYGGSTTTFFPDATLQFEGTLHSTAGVFQLGSGASFTHQGSYFFGGSGSFVGAVTRFGGALTLFEGASTQFNGTSVSFTCPTNLAGHTTLTNDLVIDGAGGIAERVVIGADSGTHTYSVSTADVVFVPSITSTTGVYYVDNIGAIQGKRMRFFVPTGGTGSGGVPTSFGPHISIRRASDGVQLWILGEMTSTSSSIEIMFIGGSWQYIPGAIHPVVVGS